MKADRGATCWPLIVCFLGMSIHAGTKAGEIDCGPLQRAGYSGFGPFDYQDPGNRVPIPDFPQTRIKAVENVHFQPEMKALNMKKYSVEQLTGEFDYTLRVFPNHPEALYAISKLEKLAKGKLPQHRANNYIPTISADCYFDRAIRFRPADSQVHFVLAMHLQDRKRLAEARVAYVEAGRLGMNTPNYYYNFGLLLTELRDWAAAREYAQRAYAGGFPLDGLRKRLTEAGFPP